MCARKGDLPFKIVRLIWLSAFGDCIERLLRFADPCASCLIFWVGVLPLLKNDRTPQTENCCEGFVDFFDTFLSLESVVLNGWKVLRATLLVSTILFCVLLADSFVNLAFVWNLIRGLTFFKTLEEVLNILTFYIWLFYYWCDCIIIMFVAIVGWMCEVGNFSVDLFFIFGDVRASKDWLSCVFEILCNDEPIPIGCV